MSETEKWIESEYARLRLDGLSREDAIDKIRAAIAEAIPKAVASIMEEIKGGK